MKFMVKNLRDYVINHFRPIFWITLIAAIIPGSIMLGHKQYLVNKAAPKGIISLELAWDTVKTNAIVRSWSDSVPGNSLYNSCNCGKDQYDYRVPPLRRDINLLVMARRDVWTDFLFIIFYSFFGWIILVKLRDELSKTTHKMPLWILPAWLAVAAGLFDCIENTGMLGYLYKCTHPVINSYIYTSFSCAKDVLIGLFLLYVVVTCGRLGLLAQLSGYIASKVQQLWRYRVIAFGLLAFALPMWFANQGQDLLININNHNFGVAIFLAVITIAAFLNWYLAKLFFQDVYIPPFVPWSEPKVMEADENIIADEKFKAMRDEKLRREKKASRFLGAITFLFPAFGILNALDAFKISYGADFFPPTTWVIISVVLVYIIVQNELINKWFGTIKNKGLFLAITITILAVILPGVFLLAAGKSAQDSHSPESLGFIALDLVMFAVAFLLFVCLRNDVRFKFVLFAQKIGTPILIAALAACLFFIVTNLWPMMFQGKDATYITLPVVFCGFMFYMVLFTVLLRLGSKVKINFTVLLLAIIVLVNIASNNDYHAARKTAPFSYDSTVTTRHDSLADYFAHWIMDSARRLEINKHDSTHPYPVFLVNIYGGGIRAAAFTSFAIAHLNRVVKANIKDSPDFEDYVFSYSGASGGTIGASVMTAYRYRYLQYPKDSLNDTGWTRLYSKDYLTPILSGMLGRDILGASVPVLHGVMNDRAGIQERLWQNNLLDDSIHYENDYYSYWNKKAVSAYRIPLLFSNTANVDNGAKGITAPVALRRTDFATDILIGNELLDSNETMPLSTVSFLSARFPYISPSAKLGDSAHFIDGGSRENSGAQTSLDIYFALQRFMDAPATKAKYPGIDTLFKKINFYFISMQNGSPNGRTAPGKKVSNPFELTSPIVTVINGGLEASALKSDSTIRFRYADRYTSIWPDVDCIPYGTNKHFSPVLPLGWQISDLALERLKRSVIEPRAYVKSDTLTPGYYAILQWIRNKK